MHILINLHIFGNLIILLVVVVTVVLLLQQKKLKIRVALEDLAVILVAGHVSYAVDHLVETGVFVFEGDLVFN
jgi:DMSO/TMAO reductase YedYZ heme-binding membrane subunit